MKSRLVPKVLVFLIVFMVLSSSAIFSFDIDPSFLPADTQIEIAFILWHNHPDHENIVFNALNTLGGFSNILKSNLMKCSAIPDLVKFQAQIGDFHGLLHAYLLAFIPLADFYEDSYYHYLNGCWYEARDNILDRRQKAITYLHDGKLNFATGQLGFLFHAAADFFAHSNWVENKGDSDEEVNLDIFAPDHKPSWLRMGFGDGKCCYRYICETSDETFCKQNSSCDISSKDHPSNNNHEKACRAAVQETIKQWYLFENQILSSSYADQFESMLGNFGVTPGINITPWTPDNWLQKGSPVPIEFYTRAMRPGTRAKLILNKTIPKGSNENPLIGEIGEVDAYGHVVFNWNVGKYSGGTVEAGDTFYYIKIINANSLNIDGTGIQVLGYTDQFKIIDFRIVQPNGGENWEIGSYKDIKWQSIGVVGNTGLISIYNTLSGTNKLALTPIAEVNLADGSYSWQVGNIQAGNPVASASGYYIKIEELPTNAKGSQKDSSDGSFIISHLKITSPAGGENWALGSKQNITWEAAGLSGNLNIRLCQNNSCTNIATNIPVNNKTYTWTVGGTAGSGYSIQIELVDHSRVETSQQFSISGFALTAPNGGQNLLQGSTYQIEWSNNGVTQNVKLELYKGTTLKGVIADNIAANSSPFTWIVPTTEAGNDYKIKISTMDNAYSDMSDANFSIVGESITIIQPNGGQTWRSGTSQAITWSSVSSAVNVSLAYSTDYGTTWQVIANSIANDGSYDWLIPDIAEEANQCLLQISDAADGYPSDVCDGVFTLLPHSPLTISAPNGGEVWRPNSSHDITWTSDDGSGIANVKLDFSEDNGSTWSAITDSTANSGTYSWTLPDTSSTQCLVKISDAANPNAFDESDGIFSISSSSSSGPDFNNDGFPDILWRKYTGTGAGNNAVWLMNGLTKIQSQAIASLADMSWKIVGVGDFTGDGKPDILWRKYSDPGKGTNAIWEMNGITKVQSINIAPLADMTWDIVGVGDFTGDGKPDILWRKYTDPGKGGNAIWEMDGVNKVVATTVTALADMTWDIVGVGDFTGDGKADILWRKYSGTGTGNNAVWEMDGVNKVRSINIAPQAAMTLDIGAVADYNKDGKVDIVWRQYASSGTNYVWLMDGLNKTTSVQIETLGDLAWHIVNNGGREH